MRITDASRQGLSILDLEPGEPVPVHRAGPFAVLVTPALAEWWLTLNTGPRRNLKTHVVKLASDMSEGRWQFTSPPIVFSEAGQLGDGTHRLTAVTMTGASVWMRVEFGWTQPELDVIDSGSPRSAADLFRWHGIADPNVASAAVTMVAKYDETRGTTRVWMNSTKANYVPTRLDLKHRYEDNELVWRRAMTIGRAVQSQLDRSLTVTLWAAAAYICLRSEAPRAEVFFEDVLREQPKTLPAAALRSWAIRRKVQDMRTGDPRENLENILRAFRARSDVRPQFVRDAGFRLTEV